VEKVRYEGCICDIFSTIQIFNNKAIVPGAAFEKLMLERLHQRIWEQIHTVVLTGKPDQDIISIITSAG
jgi:hypothetical protein